MATRLCHQLNADLKSFVALDTYFLHEVGRVGLERVRGIASPDARSVEQGQSRNLGQETLEKRATNLLARAGVTTGRSDHNTPFDQAHELIDLRRVIATIRHCDDCDRRSGLINAETDCVCRSAPVRIQRRAKIGIPR